MKICFIALAAVHVNDVSNATIKQVEREVVHKSDKLMPCKI